jgi:serine/threonine protein kinase
MFRIKDLDQVPEDEIYDLLGRPETGSLETESGEAAGPEAPKYIVKTLDFLLARRPIISEDICLIDFDNAFLASSPPEKLLPTPVEYLAPEVAVGLSGGTASDVWALGCSILRLRSGEGLFSAYDIGSPIDLLVAIHQVLGNMPTAWGDPVFDSEGRPRKNLAKGVRLSGLTDEVTERHSIEEWIRKIFDQPSTGPYRPKDQVSNTEEHPYYNPHEVSHAPFYAWKFWEPSAINFRGKYFRGYNDEWHALVGELPKIPDEEASLLFDLISKILVYEPAERLSAKEILRHPWFCMDDRS